MPSENKYVKLWISYEDYFKPLGDAEVGRLARAMIIYKSSGAEPKFIGNERFVWPAIKRDIDEANMAQVEKSQKMSDNGKKGGRPRKGGAFTENQKKQKVFEESKTSQGQGQGQGQGQSSPDGDDNRALAAVMSAYLDKINATPSQTSIDELKGYVDVMGAECCLRAFDIALDAKKATWPYIRGILRSKQSQGVRCLADWDALEEKREGKYDKHSGDDSEGPYRWHGYDLTPDVY